MKRINEITEEEKKRVALNGMIVVAGVFATGILTCFWLLPGSWSSAMKAGVSAFATIRNSLHIIYAANCVSGAILCEVAESRTKKRSFRVRNALIFLLFLGEYFLIVAAFLTIFDVSLANTPFLVQFPLIAVSFSISTLVMVATTKTRVVSSFMRKAFE